MPETTSCPMGIENKTRIDSMEKDISQITLAINDIRDKLLGRPSWVVLFILSTMSSAIVGMAVIILRASIE